MPAHVATRVDILRADDVILHTILNALVPHAHFGLCLLDEARAMLAADRSSVADRRGTGAGDNVLRDQLWMRACEGLTGWLVYVLLDLAIFCAALFAITWKIRRNQSVALKMQREIAMHVKKMKKK